MPEHEGIAAIYAAHLGRVYGYVRARVPSPQDAEDLTAETFLRAFRGLGRFRPRHDDATAAWLLRIAHNQVSNYYRQRRRAAASLEDLAMEPIAPDDPAGAAERADGRRRLLALVAGLPPRHQEVIALKYFGGLRNQEIAALLALDQRTVAAYLSRALAELQRRLGGVGAASAWELAAGEDLLHDTAADLRRAYTGLRRPGEAPALDDSPHALELALRAAAPAADEAMGARLLARLLALRPGPLARLLARLGFGQPD
jgi:RNA polymerase sigma factor (sigma-70 family)